MMEYMLFSFLFFFKDDNNIIPVGANVFNVGPLGWIDEQHVTNQRRSSLTAFRHDGHRQNDEEESEKYETKKAKERKKRTTIKQKRNVNRLDGLSGGS
jgi:hypothetical protein